MLAVQTKYSVKNWVYVSEIDFDSLFFKSAHIKIKKYLSYNSHLPDY